LFRCPSLAPFLNNFPNAFLVLAKTFLPGKRLLFAFGGSRRFGTGGCRGGLGCLRSSIHRQSEGQQGAYQQQVRTARNHGHPFLQKNTTELLAPTLVNHCIE
jgi:hypothetical protein